MKGTLNPKIFGACIIGFALVAGAYVFANLSGPTLTTQTAAVSTAANTSPRTSIAVVDSDGNGLEDWRDEFVEPEPIILDPVTVEEYKEPDTLTGQLGVNFIESYLRSKTQGSYGRSQEELIDDTVNILTSETAHSIYDTPDITIMRTSEAADIAAYANTLALIIMNNNIVTDENELFVLSDILENENVERVNELDARSEAYKKMRDQTISIPVPQTLAKEHLDLINTYHAIHKDIEAMALTIDDPAFSLLRIKRYEDDASGLSFALTNIYKALVPYANLIKPDDPAVLFVAFSPEYKS